jgi:hypothetical protein
MWQNSELFRWTSPWLEKRSKLMKRTRPLKRNVTSWKINYRSKSRLRATRINVKKRSSGGESSGEHWPHLCARCKEFVTCLNNGSQRVVPDIKCQGSPTIFYYLMLKFFPLNNRNLLLLLLLPIQRLSPLTRSEAKGIVSISFFGRPMSRLLIGWYEYVCHGRRSGGTLSTWLCHFFWYSCISSNARNRYINNKFGKLYYRIEYKYNTIFFMISLPHQSLC